MTVIDDTAAPPPPSKRAPSKDEIALLPSFESLPLARIVVPVTAEDCDRALAILVAQPVVGFDTESRPTFAKGEESDGPHVVQFATRDAAWVFQLHHPACRAAAIAVIASDRVIKAGFGLRSDRAFIRARLGVEIERVLDLNDVFRAEGYRGTVGVKAAIALVYGKRFSKSKKQTTSNWSLPQLNDQQIQYAANDAWAALQVLIGLDRPLASLPIGQPEPERTRPS